MASSVFKFAAGKVVFNDVQIRVISSVEPEISIKMLRNLSEKLRAKLPTTRGGYSMVKFACLYNHAFLEFFQLEASPVEGQSLQQKDKKMRKTKGAKNK